MGRQEVTIYEQDGKVKAVRERKGSGGTIFVIICCGLYVVGASCQAWEMLPFVVIACLVHIIDRRKRP